MSVSYNYLNFYLGYILINRENKKSLLIQSLFIHILYIAYYKILHVN